MNKSLATVLGVSLTISTITAYAFEEVEDSSPVNIEAMEKQQQEYDAIMAVFNKLDSNQDGIIDSNEAKSDKELSKEFKKIAKNGKLDHKSFQKWEQEKSTGQVKTKS